MELADILDSLASERDKLASERDTLSSRLKYAQTELESIKHSFGYKVMRVCASAIDRLLPDDTARGKLKRTVVASLRIATEEGTRSFLRLAQEKIKRREFTLPEQAPSLEMEAIAEPEV